jgi:hypothetical protein
MYIFRRHSAGYYAAMYKQDGLRGGHVIKLGANCDAAALEAIKVQGSEHGSIRSTARGKCGWHPLIHFVLKTKIEMPPHFAACGTSVHFCMVTET